eukprot:6413072-Prorocentrum_lima.AAC.1
MVMEMQSSIAQTATVTVEHSNGGNAPPTDRPPCTCVPVKAVPMQPAMHSKVELCSEPVQRGICRSFRAC